MAYVKNLFLFFTQLWDRRLLAFIIDCMMASISIILSLYLRVGEEIGNYSLVLISKHIAVYLCICAAVFLWTRPYQMVWRYASLHDLILLAKTTTLAACIYWPLSLLLSHAVALPRSHVFINWLLTIALLGAPRFLYRILVNQRAGKIAAPEAEEKVSQVIIIGINDITDIFLREIQYSPRSPYKIFGLVDQTKSRIGRHIHGIEVLGHIGDLSQILDKLKEQKLTLDMLVLTPEVLEGSSVQDLMDIADRYQITLARLPQHTSLSPAKQEEMELKPISIEDLLGRPQNNLDREGMAELIQGKRVLITGAGGTIGGELVRQICSFNPAHLILLDHSEYLLYTIDLEVGEKYPQLSRSLVLADVAEKASVESAFSDAKPDLVFHAAALKHVPLAEANPCQTILTNVMGTQNIADSCRRHHVAIMVLISTDKAINPTSVMGATKRLAEHYCQALDVQDNAKAMRTRFITVRFGNVLGSTGSVVPLFQRQLNQGGPLTVTDPEMRRYFMTVHEAVELVLQAAVLGAANNEKGTIFVLDMGQPLKIDDLARRMIRLAGLRPDIDIKIVYTGRRPGEKLYEELSYEAEKLRHTSCKSIYRATPAIANLKKLNQALKELEKVASQYDGEQVFAWLRTLVPEYQPDAEQ